MPPAQVMVSSVVQRRLPATIRVVGSIEPDRAAVVASEEAGIVRERLADVGDFVRAEQVICRLDPAPASLRLEEARAQLGTLQAKLEELENGVRPEELARLTALVAEATAMRDKWEFERRRLAELGQASAEKETHDAEMEYLASQRRLAQEQARLDMARNGARAEEKAAARFAVAAQQALVSRLERSLKLTEIRAPFDGFVVSRRAEVGEYIEAGGAVCEMVAIETVRVRVNVPESAVRFARAGAMASVEVEATGETVAGTIARVIPRADASAHTFPIEIDLPNAAHTLLPGMFVYAHVPSGPEAERLMVSKDAIVARGTSKTLFVVREGEKGASMAMPLNVVTGLELNGEIEVRSEQLKPGDMVVSRGNERLFGPSPVIPMPTSAAPASQAAQAGGAAAPSRE